MKIENIKETINILKSALESIKIYKERNENHGLCFIIFQEYCKNNNIDKSMLTYQEIMHILFSYLPKKYIKAIEKSKCKNVFNSMYWFEGRTEVSIVLMPSIIWYRKRILLMHKTIRELNNQITSNN